MIDAESATVTGVKLGSGTVDSSNYTIAQDGHSVTIKKEYLATLSNGISIHAPLARCYKSDTFTRKIPLLKTSRKVFKFCKHANRIYPTKPHHFKKRRKKIIKALCKVDDMYTYLTAFNEEKPITGLEHWTGLIHDTENLLKVG